MRFSDSWWSSLLYIFDFANLSTFGEKQAEQHALLTKIPVTDVVSGPAVPTTRKRLYHWMALPISLSSFRLMQMMINIVKTACDAIIRKCRLSGSLAIPKATVSAK